MQTFRKRDMHSTWKPLTSLTRIPIIATTANAFEEDRKAALDAGMDEHVAKPIDMEIFRKTLAKLL